MSQGRRAPAEEPAVSGLPLILPEESAPAARGTDTPAPTPRPIPVTSVFTDDEGAADQSALSAAEPLLTETMAELSQSAGLRASQRLLYQRPDRRSLGEWMKTYGFRSGPQLRP